MRLTDDLENNILVYGDLTLRLNLAFDVVLRARELQMDDSFSQAEKIDIQCEMFVENYEDIIDLDILTKTKIVSAIYEQFIFDGESLAQDDGEPVFDFEQDAKYIYASFMYDYGIDLFEQQGKLHWKKFVALFSSLSEESKFGRVVGIRTAKVPKPTKHNQEERRQLMRLKRLYRLRPIGQTKEAQLKSLDNRIAGFIEQLKPLKPSKKGGNPNGRR